MIATDFLAGSLLSWALPIGLLLAIGVYWLLTLRRRSRDQA